MNIDTDLMLTIAAGVLLASFVKYLVFQGIEYVFGDGSTKGSSSSGSAYGGMPAPKQG